MRAPAVLLICALGLASASPLSIIRSSSAVDSSAVTSLLNSLVSLDNRTDASVSLDYQNMASKSHFDHDNAPKPLFNSVALDILQGDTYKALAQLQSYYTHPNVDQAETVDSLWMAKIDNFIAAVTATPVMQAAWTFLQQQGLSSTDATQFKSQLYNLWFTMYARNTAVGSSGFESVFCGEVQGTNVIRMNNWLRFYYLEHNGLLNYHGWFTKENSIQMDTQFSWGTWQALEQAILLNSSPEFEVAIYTVCALAGGECSFTINGQPVTITVKTLTASNTTVIDQCSPSGTGTKASESPKATTKHSNAASDPQLQTLVTQMREKDVDKPAASDYTLNWGNKVSGTKDVSPNPLFTKVNEAVFQRPVYSVLIDVFDKNYFVPDVCTAEAAMSGARKAALQGVISTWTKTEVFQLAFNYLKEKGVKQATDINTLTSFLYNLWLGTYSRCKGPMGSSGFEHVFSGEWKSGTVDGQHDWTRYYLLEKAGKINYYGYFSYDAQLTGTFQYEWEKELKKEGGFLIGTSPAFDFSLLTVCALVHPGANGCKFSIDGFPLGVTSYTQACDAGTCLSTAYPTN